jgi:transaldolase
MRDDVVTDPGQLGVKIFADGADREGIAELYAVPWVRGFTTNPTLMRQAGIEDYEAFAREILELVTDRPISFEVFSDDPVEMKEHARAISSWGDNVFVKIPVTDTSGRPSAEVARRLSESGVKLNITALMTVEQVAEVASWLAEGVPAFVSLFAGRVADTGRDPVPIMSAALDVLRSYPHLELIWASPREVLNIVQADAIGCHVITVTHDLLRKLSGLGRDLDEFSLATVKMFFADGQAAGYSLRTEAARRAASVRASAGSR